MGGLNITRHAIVRYFNRIDKTKAVTDKSFDIWKKDHEEDIKIAEEKIQELYGHESTVYITTGNYNAHRKASYYLNKEKKIIMVIAENKMITLYSVDYGLDDIGNTQILQVLLDNLSRAYSEEEQYNLEKEEELRKLRFEEDILNREIEQIRASEKMLLAQKQKIESKRKIVQNTQEELKSRIDTIRERIVKSIGTLGE